ncbi:hypothetical protein HDU85_003516 [Gaertneriomyces sp. JEL0708]|nr:hypothetical protein HDU85_003516 [Gaertneriomyces sp. JEL0708]
MKRSICRLVSRRITEGTQVAYKRTLLAAAPTSHLRDASSVRSLSREYHARSLRSASTDAANSPLGLIGQPTPETHPHLLQPGEITPGITQEEYHQRRRKLMDELPDGSIAVVPGYGLRYSTNGIFYPFHQQTNMLYLCGANEPDCALVLQKSHECARGYKMVLFVRPRDKAKEIWDGPRMGLQGALRFLQADEAIPIDHFAEYIKSALNDASGPVYSDLPSKLAGEGPLDGTHILTGHNRKSHAAQSDPADPSVASPLHGLLTYPGRRGWNTPKIHRLNPILAELRLKKSPAELAVMRQAGRVSGRAFVEMMKETKPGATEHDLCAVMEYHSRRRGATGMGYVPVVAGGENALVIHYVLNTQALRDGTMVLVDAGAEYGGYPADITRSWPVNGKFTTEQRNLYQAILKVQKHCIDKCTESANVSLDELQNETFEMLRDECSTLFQRNISVQEMTSLYPHHVGHYLGLDLHDTGCITRTRKLEEGMVVTIEPGLYIPNTPAYPAGYRGIGMRIEDDVAVGGPSTGGSPIVLTAEAPKEVADIEAVMAGLVGKYN